MIFDKKLLFVTLILFLVFLLSILKKGNFLVYGSLLIILSLFSYNLLVNKKMKNKNKIYTGAILLLFFVWLFGIIYNSFNIKKKPSVMSIEGFDSTKKQKTLTSKDYEELFFILKTLAKLEFEDIRSVILTDDLNSVFDLAKLIRKSNKQLNVYRLDVDFDTDPVLGVVTLSENTNKKKGKLIDNYLTNPKMIAFSDLIQVPGFSLDLIVSLINVYKIPQITEKTYDSILDALDIDNENKPVETLGLKYFLNKTTIEDTYLEFLNYLLNENSFIKGKTLKELKISLNPTLQNDTYSFRENIQIALKSPNRLVKELNTLLILFKHYEMISKIDVITIEDLIKNKKLIQSKVLNELNKSALLNVEKEINSIFLSALNSYDLENDIFEIDLFKNYDILGAIKEKMSKAREEKVEQNLINFGEVPEKKKENKNTEFEQFLKREEYITIEKLNEISNKKETEKVETNAASIFNIRENLSKTINSIIEEMTLLLNNSKTYDAIDKNKLENGSLVDTYLYYFKNIMLILTREGRLLYTGFLILLIALFIFFIEISYY
jgi:hypothetical protein